jgi:hypothetical protein
MVLDDVTRNLCERWPIPLSGCDKIRAQTIRAKLVGLRGAFRLHGRLRDAPGKQAGTGLALPFLVRFKTIFLQVMLLAIAITVLELLFPSSPRWWSTR